MTALKKIVLFMIKTGIGLNAVWWLLIFSYGAVTLYNGTALSFAGIATLTAAMVFAVTPLLIYSALNKRFNFDTSVNPLKKLFNYLFEKEKYVSDPTALEIYQKTEEIWMVLLLGLFLVAVFLVFISGTLLSAGMNKGNAGVLVILSAIFIPPGLICIAVAYKRLTRKTPILLLTDDRIIYRHRGKEEIRYADISKVSLKAKFMDIIGKKNTLQISLGQLEYNREQLAAVINRKKDAMATPISDICSGKLGETYTPNRLSIFERIQLIILSLSLPYVIHGLIKGRLILPARRGTLALYGISATIMLFAAICLVVYAANYIIDHYDIRDNEKIYRKIRQYAYRTGYALFFFALVVSLVQHQKDFVVKREVLRSVALPQVNMTAHLIKTYGALHDPMNDPAPSLSIVIYPSDAAAFPKAPAPITFDHCEVENIYWEKGQLIVEYCALKAVGWNASLSEKKVPVPTVLKRVYH